MEQTENLPVVTVDVSEDKEDHRVLVAQAMALVIDSPEAFKLGCKLTVEFATRRKLIEKKFKPIKQSAFETHRGITAFENELLKENEAGDSIIRKKIADWSELERKEAARVADEERKRLQAEADDVALASAQEAHAAGLPEVAEDIIDRAPAVYAPRHVPTKAAGVSMRTYWGCNILPEVLTPTSDEEEAALLDAAADFISACLPPKTDARLAQALKALASRMRTRMKRYYMQANQGKIQKLVDSLQKDAEKVIGGIAVSSETRPSVRSR